MENYECCTITLGDLKRIKDSAGLPGLILPELDFLPPVIEIDSRCYIVRDILTDYEDNVMGFELGLELRIKKDGDLEYELREDENGLYLSKEEVDGLRTLHGNILGACYGPRGERMYEIFNHLYYVIKVYQDAGKIYLTKSLDTMH